MSTPEPAERPRVSVVIPVHDGAEVIAVQLAALTAQVDPPPFEVVIADNGSSDDLLGALEPWRDRLDLRVVDAGATPGIAYARNVGVAAARAEAVLFCDDDDAVSPGFVRGLADALATDDIVGGWVDLREVNPPRVLAWVDEPPREHLPEVFGRHYALGGCMGIRRAVHQAHGGFDLDFRHGHEEVDLAWRVQLAGGSVGFVPQAWVHYRQRETVRALIRQRYRFGYSYTQMYAAHREQISEHTSLRRELRKILHLLGTGPRAWREPGTRGRWLGQVAWVAGRLRGDLAFSVRAPQ